MAARPATLSRATAPAEAVRHWTPMATASAAAATPVRTHVHRRPRPHQAASTTASTTTATAAERVRVSATKVRSSAAATLAPTRARDDPVIHTRANGSTPMANCAAMFLFANVAAGGKA
jgi:hypothetical protein